MLHNLQMLEQSLMKTTEASLPLEISSWIMWAAEEMKQTSLIAHTMELVSTTVITGKMQGWSVRKVCCVCMCVCVWFQPIQNISIHTESQL